MRNTREQDSEKFSMIDRWRESKQTILQFCKEEKIAPHVFYYWKGKFKRQNNDPGKFVKIVTQGESKGKMPYCELQFTNGMRLVFNEQPSACFVKQLL